MSQLRTNIAKIATKLFDHLERSPYIRSNAVKLSSVDLIKALTARDFMRSYIDYLDHIQTIHS